MIHDVRDQIDPRQFGCLKGTSTTFCLLEIIHHWLSEIDQPGNHLSLCFLDFSKAFDRINIIKKASKRLHILRILKRASVPPQDLLVIYASLVRSVLEYCCPVWHNNLPQYLSDLVERVQKRAFRIILPNTTYSEALAELKSMSLSETRDELCKKTIKKIVKGTSLSHLLPTTRVCAHGRDLRNGNNRSSFSCRTNRFKNSFFPSMINHLNI